MVQQMKDRKHLFVHSKSKKSKLKLLGFCYWGAEWVAFRGTESTNGSSWENQALWDFNFNALPVMQAFNEN
jgi:arabinogalactan endo-1,4-beta-galactosidase